MPYDLYGNHYKSERDAINAELAQMSEIDNRINNERLRKLETQQRSPNQEIWEYIQVLEQRIEALERQINPHNNETKRSIH
jgi:hypothetical protein